MQPILNRFDQGSAMPGGLAAFPANDLAWTNSGAASDLMPQQAAPSLEVLTQFLEMNFTPLDMDTVLEAVIAQPADCAFRYIVTPNVDHVVRLQRRRSDLWPAYRGAWMTLCDSRILAKMARLVGSDLPVVPGSDLTRQMFEKVIGRNDRVAILGGRPDMIAQITDQFGLTNVRHYNPPMGFIRNPKEVRRAAGFVVEAEARYSFFAVGSPQQELLAHRVRQTRGACGIGFCVGASLDFLGGEQERAPMFMQAMAMEWLFRLLSDPQRMWRRYLVEGPQILLIHRDWRRSTLDPGSLGRRHRRAY